MDTPQFPSDLEMVHVVTEVLAAADPRSTDDEFTEAVQRAAALSPVFALASAAGLLRGMLAGLVERGADPAQMMTELRRRHSVLPPLEELAGMTEDQMVASQRAAAADLDPPGPAA